MPRNKKTSTIVVRPITRGARTPKKVVLATLAELNDHAPMVCSPTFAPLLRTRPLPPCHCPWPWTPALPTATPANTTAAYADAQASVLQEEITAHLRKYEETKPWKQESRSHRQYGWGWARRNPGPDDGKTWVSRQFVCGTAVEPRLSADAHDEDVEHEWQAEWDGPSETEHPRDRARMEVSIMDIAKPAKLRGTFKPRL